MEKKIKVLFVKPTVEGHDIGMRVVAQKCRDSGLEAILMRADYAQEVVKSAIEEDVHVIGITCSIGNHLFWATELKRLLKEKGMDTPIIVGGIIPGEDITKLQDIGVKGIFGAGSTPAQAVEFITRLVSQGLT